MKLKKFLKAWPKEYQASPKLLSLMEEAKRVFEQWGELVHQDFIDQENRYINIQDGNVVKELDLKQPGESIQVLYSQDWNGSRYEIFDMWDDLNYNWRLIAKVWSDGKTFEYIRKDYLHNTTTFINSIKKKLVKMMIESLSRKDRMHRVMFERYKKMVTNNKLPDVDFRKLLDLPLTCADFNGVTVINRSWFWTFGSSSSAKITYDDMDKTIWWEKVRAIAHLQDSLRWKQFADPLLDAELMSLDDSYRLMNMIVTTLGVTTHIDETYIDRVYCNYRKENLPLDHEFGRVLRALSVIMGSWFELPISVTGLEVRSVACSVNFACFFNNANGINSLSPLFKIRSTSAA